MKKIAIITCGKLPVPAVKGGAVENLIQILIDKNEVKPVFEFTVFSISDEKAIESAKKYEYTTFYFVDSDIISYKIKRAVRYIINKFYYIGNEYIAEIGSSIKKNNIQFDALLLENAFSYAVYLHEKCPFKIIQHIHTDIEKSTNWSKSLLSTDLILTVSNYVANSILSNSNTAICRIETLYNGIDRNRFSNRTLTSIMNLKSELGINQEDCVVLFSGRLDPVKGVKELLLAFSKLKNLHKTKLLIVGASFYSMENKTKYIEELEVIAKNIGNNIVFTGYVDYAEMHTYYQIADFAVFPSIWEEALGLVCLESLAASLPVIITKVGGMPETVTDECAIIIDRDTDLVNNLTYNIDYLIEHPEVRNEMSRNAYERSSMFTDDVYYNRFVDIISKVF